MAEFRFYALRAEAYDWIDGLSRLHRFRFVLRMPYYEPQPVEFDRLTDQIVEKLAHCSSVFLFSDEYSRYPPVLNGPMKSDEGPPWYDLSQSLGGPSLDLELPINYLSVQHLRIVHAVLHYQPYYGDPTGEEWQKPPEALKRAFQDVRTLLCRQMEKRYALARMTRGGKTIREIKPVWVGRKALELLDAGKAVIAPGYRWITGRGLHRSRSDL